MKTRSAKIVCLLLTLLFVYVTLISQETEKMIQLPEPQMDIGRPLMQVLKDRQSSRSFSKEKLTIQTLSNILWAAFGVNRPESGKRTAPSARNRQEISIYMVMNDGVYLYEAGQHTLKQVLTDDIRVLTGRPEWVQEAPLNLIYVADFSKLGDAEEIQKFITSSTNAGFISQNVYLYCASEGLATVVRGSVDKSALEKAMGLRPDQKIILAQTVGYPKKEDTE